MPKPETHASQYREKESLKKHPTGHMMPAYIHPTIPEPRPTTLKPAIAHAHKHDSSTLPSPAQGATCPHRPGWLRLPLLRLRGGRCRLNTFTHSSLSACGSKHPGHDPSGRGGRSARFALQEKLTVNTALLHPWLHTKPIYMISRGSLHYHPHASAHDAPGHSV